MLEVSCGFAIMNISLESLPRLSTVVIRMQLRFSQALPSRHKINKGPLNLSLIPRYSLRTSLIHL